MFFGFWPLYLAIGSAWKKNTVIVAVIYVTNLLKAGTIGGHFAGAVGWPTKVAEKDLHKFMLDTRTADPLRYFIYIWAIGQQRRPGPTHLRALWSGNHKPLLHLSIPRQSDFTRI